MFFTPPKLSDEAASEICEFLHYFIMRLESHYMHQLRRHTKAVEDMYTFMSNQRQLVDAEDDNIDADEMHF
jgi:hypothetical protein